MPELHVLRVFVDDRGAAGNHLGVMRDCAAIGRVERQQTAAALGYSETVFVDDADRLQIFTPTTELAFAGHPLVGAGWLLDRPALHPPAGRVAVRSDPPLTWISVPPAFCPAWDVRQEASPAAVDALAPPPGGHVLHWAFADEPAGLVRARVFAPDYGVPEDPATGSAAIILCAALGRELVIRQGEGSEIWTRPGADGIIDLGGRVRAVIPPMPWAAVTPPDQPSPRLGRP